MASTFTVVPWFNYDVAGYYAPVLHIDTPINHKLIKIAYSNGEEIVSTEDHPYYVKDKGWSSFNPEQTLKKFGIETARLEPSVITV